MHVSAGPSPSSRARLGAERSELREPATAGRYVIDARYVRAKESGIRHAALGRLREGTLREDLRQRGLARARAFSWERTAAATLEVYREAAVAGPMRVHRAAP